jgi:phosphatidylserine/phosphatidylglycerophosphate/cardiolipin synthase-like enzyme
MFNQVAQEIQIVSPYWSSRGITVLLRHITRTDFTDVRIRTLTQPQHKLGPDEISAIFAFRDFMLSRGAKVEIASPEESGGRIVLVHAKAVVRDRAVAYLGSANLTLNGIEQSLELGAVLRGAQALQLSRWIDTIASGMTMWREEHFCV